MAAASVRKAYTALLDAYCAQLRRSPWSTQAATSALLWGAGDVAAQAVERSGGASRSHGGGEPASGESGACADAARRRDDAPAATDMRRVALVTAYGGLFVGPLGHGWYELLERVTTRIWPAGSPRLIAAKIAADTIMFGPVHVASFFGLMGLAAGETRAEIAQRFRDKFWPTLLAESVAWPAVQGINFWKVPVRHQLLVVNVVSLADCTFLSWVKHQGDIGRWHQLLKGGPFGP